MNRFKKGEGSQFVGIYYILFFAENLQVEFVDALKALLKRVILFTLLKETFHSEADQRINF